MRRYPDEYATERIEVKLERLDRARPDEYVPALIKADVERAERQGFEGARETITRHKPVIVFEHGLGGSDH
jgi:FkbM family methyltransferase